MSTITRLLSSSRQITAPPTSTTFAPCTWSGHCLGDTCASNDECDNDWICVNKACSPCCDDSSETGSSSTTLSTTLTSLSRTAAGTRATSTLESSTTTGTATSAGTSTSTTQSATATNGTHHGLTTGSAVGIGVGIVGLLAISVGIGFWLWYRRRSRLRAWEMPADIRSGNPTSRASDKRFLVATGPQNASRGELAAPVKPTELSAVELVELEGDSTRREYQRRSLSQKSSVQFPAQAVPGDRSPRYRFEEYAISPDNTLQHVADRSGSGQPSPYFSHDQEEQTHLLSPVSPQARQASHSMPYRDRNFSVGGRSGHHREWDTAPELTPTTSRGERDQARDGVEIGPTKHVRQDSDSAYTFFRWPDDSDETRDKSEPRPQG